MNRRKFIFNFGMAVLAGSSVLTLAGCGKSSDNNPAPATSFSVQSSVDFAHSHNIAIPFADLTSPPAGGQTYTSDGSHVHTVTLTQAELAQINGGTPVTKTSSSSGAPPHTHTWTIAKPA